MPTKVSEFMISGTPILLYCDPKVSLLDHAKKHQWAHIVSDKKQSVLKTEIVELISNLELRKKISTTAIEYASNQYATSKIREDFKNKFINCQKSKN
jgi:glycosyltransferase involved in cell wall biosynthesis